MSPLSFGAHNFTMVGARACRRSVPFRCKDILQHDGLRVQRRFAPLRLSDFPRADLLGIAAITWGLNMHVAKVEEETASRCLALHVHASRFVLTLA